MEKSKLINLLGLSDFKNKLISLIPTKTSQLTNDSNFLSSNKSAKIIFGGYGDSGLGISSMSLSDIYKAMPTPSIWYYTTTNESDKIFTDNTDLLSILKEKEVSFCGTFEIVKVDLSRTHIRYVVGLSGGATPDTLLIGISSSGEIDVNHVIHIGKSQGAPLTTSLSVNKEGISALDGTVGKVLNDNGSQMRVYKGDDGNLHFRDWSGADTVIPFSSSSKFKKIALQHRGNTYSANDLTPGDWLIRTGFYTKSGGDATLSSITGGKLLYSAQSGGSYAAFTFLIEATAQTVSFSLNQPAQADFNVLTILKQ